MNEIYKYILENITGGKMEKQAAVRLISMLKKNEERHSDDIAIIGMGVKLPMVSNLGEFWNIILSGGSFLRRFPAGRQEDITSYMEFSGYKDEVKFIEGAFLDRIDQFDFGFFNIPPKEAELMDPNQRLLLETVWQAIEDGGYGGGRLAGSKTGVYVGFESNPVESYAKMINNVEPSSGQMAIPGNLQSIIAGRLSYLLDLKGPSIVVDTACASSLVAIDLACQALENGCCNMAIAGGIRLNLVPLIRKVNMGIESSDGITRTFDYSADGSGDGEGVAIVLLKPLKAAIKDRDPIHAVIKGHAVNHGGSSTGLTAPNPAAQGDVIVTAWNSAGINPETIGYIEAHGTATRLGDPIEIKGIQNAFRRFTQKKQFCGISAMKSNTGHLFECAGAVNLITGVMALKNGIIPPSMNFGRPNEEINFSESPLYVNIKPKKWPELSSPKRCGVSAFGISGTNCHFVLEEAPEKNKREIKPAEKSRIFMVSAMSEVSLAGIIKRYAEFFDNEIEYGIEDICFAAGCGRGHYCHRIAILVKNVQELRTEIFYLQKQEPSQMKNLQRENMFYGYHKTIDAGKKLRQDGEIARESKLELDKEAAVYLERYAAGDGDDLLIKLCALYVNGADACWDRLYLGEEVYKARLPVYFFQPERCWLKIPGSKGIHCKEYLFHRMIWKESNDKKHECPERLSVNGLILVLKDKGEVADKVIERLTTDGNEIIEITLGERYEKISRNKYIAGKEEESFISLMKDLNQKAVSKVIHLASVSLKKEIHNLCDLEASQQTGFYSLLFLVKALMGTNTPNDVDMVLFANNVNEVTGEEEEFNPENAPLFGIGSVAGTEFPNLVCRHVDIDGDTSVEHIIDEIGRPDERLMVAYRKGTRYIREFGTIAPEDAVNRELNIQEGGTYIITGGTGGMALEISKYLAGRAGVKLAFISRSKLPDRNEWEDILKYSTNKKITDKIKSIKEITANGSEVYLYRADVSKPEEIGPVIDEIRRECGEIRGIVHCAGIAGGGLIADKKTADAEKVLGPKIYGTWLLHKLTEKDNPDFMVLFSSVASLGGIGQSDYSAANSYLDAFSLLRNKMGYRTLAINWAPWKETGMWLEHGQKDNELFYPMCTDQAIGAFNIVMGKDFKTVFIGQINFNADETRYFRDKMSFKLSESIMEDMKSLRKLPGVRGGEMDSSIVLLGKEDEKDYTATERSVAGIWNETLGLGSIDIYDNFYELGGDSIKALRILNTINRGFSLNIKVSDLLCNPTINRFSTYLDHILNDISMHSSGKSIYSSIIPVGKRECYPLSSAQKRLFILDRVGNRNTSYNITRAYRIDGNLDTKKLEDVLNELIKRHESLRTSFVTNDGSPVQIVHEQADFQITYEDCDKKSVDERIRNFVDYFDLGVPKLLRVKIFNISGASQVLVFDLHHIITDGASMDVLIQELALLYAGKQLAPLEIQYRDYAVWQQSILNNTELNEYEVIKNQKTYWMDIYRDKIPVLNIPTDHPRTEKRSFEGSSITFVADRQLSKAVNRLAQETETTLNMVLISVYFILLSRYSGDEDIIIGSPIAGRSCAELENMVGLLVNTVALRAAPARDKKFLDFLEEVKQRCMNAYENQDYQFDDLVSSLSIKRDKTRNLLFDTMFALQNVGMKIPDIKGVRFSPYEISTTVSKFDLMLEAFEQDDGIKFRLEYSTSLFIRQTVERFSNDYLYILSTLTGNRELKIGDIELAVEKTVHEAYVAEEDVEFNF
jgi:acyl transferase domain-containing protein